MDDMYLYPMGQFRGMKMSHMIAGTDAELHAMADRIGVARKWFQGPPRHTDPHYDIAVTMRAKALRYGAVAITLRQCSAMCLIRRETGKLPPPDRAEALATLIRNAEGL